MKSLRQIKRSTYKRGGFKKSVIKKLTFKCIVQLVEVQMELRERISDAKKKKE